ncbi:MAG: hemerythrin family protein [Rhodospirillaceae bacterium]|nr:MAG: hemerythrin family protein [Rhodospirillaceae bacterium]
MSLMTWNDSLSVGITVIDDDHKKLVAMVNDLYDSMQVGRSKEATGRVLQGLIDYTLTHFAREERFFAETGYPASTTHKREHEDLTRQVIDVQKKYSSGSSSILSVQLMGFLKNWLLNHIQGSDKAYAPHLLSKGIR